MKRGDLAGSRATRAIERAASLRFARERARGTRFGKPPPSRPRRTIGVRLYLPDNL